MQEDTPYGAEPDGGAPEEGALDGAEPDGADPDGSTGMTSTEPAGAHPDAPAGPDDATLVGAPVPVEEATAVGSAALAELVRSAAAPAAEPPPGAQPAPVALDVSNEAIPAVAPEAGTEAIGSIPAAHARRVWARVQASNWRLFLIRFLSAGVAVVLTVAFLPGLGFAGWEWGTFTQIGIVFGLLNATVKPLLQFLVLRFIFSTYGIVVVVINALLLVLLATILEGTFVTYRPISILLGGAVVGALGLILETLLGATPPVLDRDYRERNGLK